MDSNALHQLFSLLPAVSGSCSAMRMLESKGVVLKLVLQRLKWYMFTMSEVVLLYSWIIVHRSQFSLWSRVFCFWLWAFTDVPGTGFTKSCIGIPLCGHSTNGATTTRIHNKQQFDTSDPLMNQQHTLSMKFKNMKNIFEDRSSFSMKLSAYKSNPLYSMENLETVCMIWKLVIWLVWSAILAYNWTMMGKMST